MPQSHVGYEEILHLLTHKVRLMADSQVAQMRGVSIKVARQGMQRLEERGLLELQTAMIHPPLHITGPLVDWRPDACSPEPDWQALSWQTESRWKKSPVRALIAWATKKGRQYTGGPIGGRPPRQLEISHDISVTELYLQFHNTNPEAAASWIPEDALTEFRSGQKIPDAVICENGEKIILELAGKYYSAKRLSAIGAAHSHSCYRIY
jgi:transposase